MELGVVGKNFATYLRYPQGLQKFRIGEAPSQASNNWWLFESTAQEP